MSDLFLFIISFFMVSLSSYFFACIIKPKRFENAIIYLALILISQVIISFEFLSLIKQVNSLGILLVNVFIFILSIVLWKYSKAPHIDFKPFTHIKHSIIQAVKKDKILFVLSILFVFASLLSLFFTLVVPTNSWDSMSYHLARIGFWIQNETLAHFDTSSVRQVIFPINSEMLILWSMAFLKRDYFSLFPQYFAYLGSIFILYSYLSYFKISTKRILWSIFIFASLPAVILESSSAQTNLFVGFLLFCSLYLFVYGVRENNKKSIIFSAIAFSINLGIKITAFFFIPVFGLIYLLISIREKKKEFYKPLMVFIIAAIPAFLVLSSYNYILNYIDYGTFLGTRFFILRHSITLGFDTFMANVIRYFLLFIDFTGIKGAEFLAPNYLQLKDFLFNLFKLNNSDGLLFLDLYTLNVRVHESLAKFGLLGFVIILPVILRYSFIKVISSKDRIFYLGLTGLITLIFIVTISLGMGFCIWNNRYLLSAIVMSSALLTITYTRRFSLLKGVIALLVIFNYIVIPVFAISKPLPDILKLLSEYNFISFRNEVRLRHEGSFKEKMSAYYLIKYAGLTIPDNSRIGLIFPDDGWYYPFFEENPTWKIDPVRYELLIKKKNFNDYDYLIISGPDQNIEMITDKGIRFNYTVKDGKIDYKMVEPEDPIIVYYDKDVKPVVSLKEKPVYMINILNAEQLPDNFKRIKRLDLIKGNSLTGKEEEKLKFFIYKKIY